MTDITKARKYLKSRNSDLQHLTSFGLMYNTAKTRYTDIKMKINTRRESYSGEHGAKEVQLLLDFAVLTYMRKHGTLPPNVSNIFTGTMSVDELREAALGWLYS